MFILCPEGGPGGRTGCTHSADVVAGGDKEGGGKLQVDQTLPFG